MSSNPVHQQYRLIHDIYVLLDDGDRRVLSIYDLTTSQYSVLRLLDPDEGRRLISLSAQLLCARSTITRIVDQLEAIGLVRRVDDPSDRRAQRAILTGEGAALLERAQVFHEKSLEQRMSSLDEAEQRQLQQLLGKLRDALRNHLDRMDEHEPQEALAE